MYIDEMGMVSRVLKWLFVVLFEFSLNRGTHCPQVIETSLDPEAVQSQSQKGRNARKNMR